MNLGQIMTLEVEIVRPQDPIQRAARMMRDAGVGMIPVVEREVVIGVVTDQAVAARFVAQGLDFSGTSVSDVMSREVFYCYEDQTLEDAARLLEEKQLRRVIVLSRDKRLVGVVSGDDLARSLPREKETDVVNGLIQDELSAVESYRQALDHSRGMIAAELRRLENDHEKAVAMLQQAVAERGVEPAMTPAILGDWALAGGETITLQALKQGEQRGIKAYERELSKRLLAADVRALIQSHLLPQMREHIPALERLLRGEA